MLKTISRNPALRKESTSRKESVQQEKFVDPESKVFAIMSSRFLNRAWFTILILLFLGETLPAMAANIHPAVVRVVVPEGGGATSYGSGTLVAASENTGLVLTNWHVVRDRLGKVEVVFPNGFRSAAQVLRTDRDWDLAALLVWRPNVQPVPIAKRAPLQGEVLSIAGYGSGNYRAASGKCVQYLSPGGDKPFEMVELSAKARQGDSGGPIFNQHGEMAGVLFGSAWGKTSGSHAVRIRNFLSTIDPQLADGRLAPQPHLSQAQYAQNVTPGPRVASQYQLQPTTYTPQDINSNPPKQATNTTPRQGGEPNYSNPHGEPWRGVPGSFHNNGSTSAPRAPQWQRTDPTPTHPSSQASHSRVSQARTPSPKNPSDSPNGDESSELQESNQESSSDTLDDTKEAEGTHDSRVTKDQTIWDHLKNILCIIGGIAILVQVAKVLNPEDTSNPKHKK